MKHYGILVCLFFLFGKIALAQNFNFGEVSLEELQEKEHPLEPDAPAAILYKRAYSGFKKVFKSGSNSTNYRFQKRIKLYTKEGLEQANLEVEYHTKDVFSIKEASIYQLRNGEIKKYSLSKNDFYTQKTSAYKEKISFTFPDVQAGDIIEFEYEFKVKSMYIFPVWYFQETIPVNYSEIYVQIPGIFRYRENTTSVQSDIQRLNPKDHPNEFTKKEIKASKKDHVFKYTATNVKSIKFEKWLYNQRRYLDKLDIEWVGFTGGNSGDRIFYTSWQNAVNQYYERTGIDPNLHKSSYFSKDINERIQDVHRDQQVHWVLNFLHQKFADRPTENSPRYTLEESYEHSLADDFQKDQHFINILRYLGFKAYVAGSINRTKRIFTPQSYAFIDVYFVAVLENNQWNYYEPSDPLLTKGFLPANFYNQKVLIHDPEMTNPLKNLIQPASTIEEWKIDFSIPDISNPEHEVHAQINRKTTGFDAFAHRNLFRKLDDLDLYIDALEEALDLSEIDNYRIYNEFNPDEDLLEVFSVKLKDAYQFVNEDLYIQPLLFLSKSGTMFTEETRLYPVELPYPYTKRIQSSFEIPEGYEVDFLPENQQIPVLGAKADFRIRYVLDNNTIHTQYSLSFRKAEFNASEYPELKRLFEEISILETTPIILKKTKA